jgi:hypothetical protein
MGRELKKTVKAESASKKSTMTAYYPSTRRRSARIALAKEAEERRIVEKVAVPAKKVSAKKKTKVLVQNKKTEKETPTESATSNANANVDLTTRTPRNPLPQISMTAAGQLVANNATGEFTGFSLLPLEVRMKIWGYAAPEPYTVVQRESRTSRYRYTFSRPVPALLHACRESRYEYLEIDDDDGAPLERRRREHPVYKLSFNGRTRRSPVYFSTDIDTFWGMKGPGLEPLLVPEALPTGGTIYLANPFSGIAELDIARDLKRLTVELDMRIMEVLLSFPKLETLTLVTNVWNSSQRHSPWILQDGNYEAWMDYHRNEVKLALEKLQTENPLWKAPTVDVLDTVYYVATRNVDVPLDGHGSQRWNPIVEDPSD